MMKGKKRMIVLSITALIVIGLCFLFRVYVSRYKMDGPDMEYKPDVISVDYYYGQNEYGQSESYSLKDYRITHSINGGTFTESNEECKNIGIDFYNSLDDIIRQYDMTMWNDLPVNDMEVLDGPVTSFRMEMSDGTIIQLGKDYEMPENGYKAIKDIIDLFDSNLKNE